MNKRTSWVMPIVLAGAALCAVPASAATELVTNGGFEAGDFSGWTVTGDGTFNGVQCPGAGAGVYAGNCSAYFGPVGAAGGIAQVIDLGSAGMSWDLSFAFMPDGGSPSSFSVSFGGQTLLSLQNAPLAGYTLYRFTGVSTAAAMTLAFSFVDPPGFLSLDAVSVTAVPEPATAGLLGAGLAGLLLAARRRRACAAGVVAG